MSHLYLSTIITIKKILEQKLLFNKIRTTEKRNEGKKTIRQYQEVFKRKRSGGTKKR